MMFKKLFALFSSAAIGSVSASIYDVPLKTLVDDKETSLAEHKGKVMLIVNVASKCGLTKQYAQLEELQKKYADKGFTVVGMPCNQFGKQEPGTGKEIETFCSTTYGVTFPIYGKLKVNGKERHDLYTILAGKDSPYPGLIKWNFTKFLISKDGKILARFSPRTTPDDAKVTEAIEAALKQ
ncbi:glutathione peroxidase [Rubritalea squalenifaciens DSM 18772]|uniref:Glutathione peroxidase n=2 Tax=Rubritalea squalenifaciens TaxID=407226 RepID=A0A1M6NLR9_9BACT|nr:glutathione peroxidase [Rubritalea squalenifaciens DSM 18772]